MKVVTVKGVRCPHCEVLITEELPGMTTLYECGECGAIYDTLDEATECCRE